MSSPAPNVVLDPQEHAPVVTPDWKAFQKVDHIVNKTYLSEIESYEVVPCPTKLKDRVASDSACFFPITKFVYDKEENIYQKLTSVYASAASAGVNVAMLIKASPEEGVELYLGACDEEDRENGALPKTRLLYNSFVGNFPGCRTSKDSVILDTQSTQAVINRSFDPIKYHAAAAVSSIASLRGQQRDEKNNAFYQGIEKAVEAMDGTDYAILILARALRSEEIRVMQEELEMLHTQLNPFAKSSFSVNSSNSEGTSKTLSDSLTKTMNETKSHTLGIGRSTSVSKSESTFSSNSFSIGASFGGKESPFSISPSYAHSRGKSNGTSRSEGESRQESDTESFSEGQSTSITTSDGTTVTLTQGSTVQVSYENKQISEILAAIDQQLKRLKTGAGLGMFATATYFLAPTVLEARTGASAYKAVISGDNTYLESASINVWRKEKFNNVLSYLCQLCHPVLAMDSTDDPAVTTPAVVVSSPELAIQMSLPRRSLVKLPVRESVSFGRSVITLDNTGKTVVPFELGKVYHLGNVEKTPVNLNMESLTMHTFITGTTGSGKSNTVYCIMDGISKANKSVHFLVIEPAKGEYKAVFGQRADVKVYGTNPLVTKLLRINPFRFPASIHVLEHIDRLLSIFNVCWPMEAAMPAVLKQALERAYVTAGWNLRRSTNSISPHLYPTFTDVMEEVANIMDESDYSSDNKGDYKGALCTRLQELATGLNGMMFVPDDLTDEQLFEENVIVDLSLIGSPETKSLIMGLLIVRLQEYRQSSRKHLNSSLHHVTVLEEAHHLLKRTSTQQSMDSANMVGKSVEMLSNAFAEMRTYGEAFIIADQSPEQVDMSVIRNTNTKIVMRLPTHEDHKVVGKSIGLNDIQIAELAKLPTGVAAVYQNDWMDAVLTQMPRYNHSDEPYENEPEDDNRVFYDADVESLLDALMLKNGIDAMVDQLKGNRVDAVARLRLPTQVKRQLINYINNTEEDRIDRLGRVAYELFNMREAVDRASAESLEEWKEDMLVLLEPSLAGYSDWDKETLLLVLLHEHSIRNPRFRPIYIKLCDSIM